MKNRHLETIEALVIRCIDYRFVTSSRNFITSQGWLDKYDLITFPGASKNIHLLFDAIEVSNSLHKPKKVVIVDHEDCGAFGKNNSFEEHRRSLHKAKRLLDVVFPALAVELFYNSFEGVKKVS